MEVIHYQNKVVAHKYLAFTFMKSKIILRIIAIYLVSILFIANIWPLKNILQIFFGGPYYYTTKAHGFNAFELNSKGLTFDMAYEEFNRYKETCKQPNITLYRTFMAKPYKFWLWGEYLFHPKYKLPYLPMPVDYDYNLLNQRCE
jgi:hypothetical protein